MSIKRSFQRATSDIYKVHRKAMEAEKKKAEASLAKFSAALDEVEGGLRPVLAAIDGLRATSNEDELDAMSRARLHITLCYATNTLFCMYLRTQGIDPLTHPVADEITRVQEAFLRMRKVEAGLSAGHQKPADRDRRRHIQNAKKSEEALSKLVFPEEAELLRALRNVRKKSGQSEGRKDDTEVEGAELEKAVVEDELDHIRATEEEIEEMHKAAQKKERKEKRKREEKERKASKKSKKAKKSKKKSKD